MSVERLAARYRNLLADWVGLVARRGALTVILACALTIAALIHFISAIEIDTSTTDMLSKDLPFRQYARELDTAFPQTLDTLVVVIEGETAGLADDAALAMGVRLRTMPEIFEDVYDLRGEPFFKQNGLLYLDTDELYELSDRLAEAQPFLGMLWRERNLVGLFHMMGLAADEAAKPGGSMPLALSDVFGAIADVAEAQVKGEFKILDWSGLISGDAAETTPISERRRFIIVKPRLDFASLQPAEKAIDTVRGLAGELNINAAHGLRLRLTGSAALEQEELASVKTGMGLAALVSLVLVLVILLAGLGSVRLMFATLVTLIMGLIWTASFALLSVGSLNLISVAFAVLFIGLSVDFGIHFGLRYREGLSETSDNLESLRNAASGVGGPLTLCAVSAGGAFFAFLPTDYVGLAELGVIAGSGMFIALFANLTVLPALASLMPPHPRKTRNTALSIPGKQPAARMVFLAALLLVVGSIALLPRVRFDFDPLNLKDPNTESVATLLDLMKAGARSHYSAEVLVTDLASAQKLASSLEKLPEVDHTMTLTSFVPKDQDDKLSIISETALFMGPSLSAKPSLAGSDAATRKQAWRELTPKLERLGNSAPDGLAKAARQLRDVMAGLLTDDVKMALFEQRLLIGLTGRLNELKTALNAALVTLDSLPGQLRQRWLTKDGRALIEVFPKADLRRHKPLEAFVTSVRKLAPSISGTPVTVMEAGRAVLGAFMKAGVVAVIGICVLLFVVLRRPLDVALVFAPVVLAGLWTLAATVVSGLSFNLANVIVLPLLFGLGVAGAIHLVARVRDSGGTNQAMQTSTPRAVVLSALTTIGSFGSISLSAHPGTASMGVLLMIAISMTMVATLVFLPALMRLIGGGQSSEET